MKDALTNRAPGVPRLRGIAPEPDWACTRCPITFDSSSETKSAIRSAGTPQLGCRIDEVFCESSFENRHSGRELRHRWPQQESRVARLFVLSNPSEGLLLAEPFSRVSQLPHIRS